MTPHHFLASLRERISLAAGTDHAGTVERIAQGASLTTENVWLMICSAILASIGLDTSSTAVIIGAMLISPLMGPILGVGMAMGVTDRHLLQRSFRELTLGMAASLLASVVYFTISPLAEATPELLSRVHPTLLDVGVAFFGGIAGIVAGSRRSPSLALPGVAIATALMPPLCTAGFGIASGRWNFVLGAMYLFTLNAIFIAVATFLVVRFLRFPHHQESNPRQRRVEHRVVFLVALVAMLPSIWFLYETVVDLRRDARVARYVSEVIERPGRSALQWEVIRDTAGQVLQVYVAGRHVALGELDSLQRRLAEQDLGAIRLELIQSDVSVDDFHQLQGEMQRVVLRAASAGSAQSDSLRQRERRDDSLRISRTAELVRSAFPEMRTVIFSPAIPGEAGDSVGIPGYLVSFTPRVPARERRRLLDRAAGLAARAWEDRPVRVVER